MTVQGIMKFIQLADDSTPVPSLQKKCYADYRLTLTEWTNLDLLHQILKVSMFHDLTHVVVLLRAMTKQGKKWVNCQDVSQSAQGRDKSCRTYQSLWSVLERMSFVQGPIEMSHSG